MEVFPEIKPAVLSSSIVHFVPLIRDVFQMLGGFEVRNLVLFWIGAGSDVHLGQIYFDIEV
jgi:hypothetical protein